MGLKVPTLCSHGLSGEQSHGEAVRSPAPSHLLSMCQSSCSHQQKGGDVLSTGWPVVSPDEGFACQRACGHGCRRKNKYPLQKGWCGDLSSRT